MLQHPATKLYWENTCVLSHATGKCALLPAKPVQAMKQVIEPNILVRKGTHELSETLNTALGQADLPV